MAECNVACSLTSPVVSGNCTPASVTLPTLPPSVNPPVIPTAADVTTEAVDGTGVFDVYMRAGMNQLETQYQLGRIKGADYAAAYVAQIQLMMTEANKFVIGMVQAEIAAKLFDQQYLGAAYDALVKEASVHEMKSKGDLLCQQIAELKENGKVERELKMAQKQTQIQQAALYKRQITGYNEKNKNENAKMLLDAWAVQAVEEPEASQYKITPMGTAPKLEIFANELKVAGGFGTP